MLFLPPALGQELPFDRYPCLRLEGEVADVLMGGAWIPRGDGRRYFILSPRVLREARLAVGNMAKMGLAISDQSAMDMPAALSEGLQRDPRARAA